jgi:hypothetical protein
MRSYIISFSGFSKDFEPNIDPEEVIKTMEILKNGISLPI